MILISNDDSIFSKGIKALIEVSKKFDKKIVVVAPDKPQSAKSHSITLGNSLTYRKSDLFGPDVEAYECSGSPADSVKLALNYILDEKPDLILSGINHGANTSVNLIYSGTVAAAVEGAMHDIPSLAFSVDSHDPDANFDATVVYAEKIIDKILKTKDNKVCLNINVPNIPLSEIKGTKVCKQTIGAWFEDFELDEKSTKDNLLLNLKGKYVNFEPQRTDTDIWAIENNYVPIVPIKIDWTNYEDLNKIKDWKF